MCFSKFQLVRSPDISLPRLLSFSILCTRSFYESKQLLYKKLEPGPNTINRNLAAQLFFTVFLIKKDKVIVLSLSRKEPSKSEQVVIVPGHNTPLPHLTGRFIFLQGKNG